MKRHLTSRERIVRSYCHTVQSVAARSIVHKFLKHPRYVPSLKEHEWVYRELYVWLRSFKDLILHGNRKKKHRWKLSITLEKEYIPLLHLDWRWIPRWFSGWWRLYLVLTYSEGPGSNLLEANFSRPYFFSFFFFTILFTCVVHIASNIMW